ncbi:phosphoenolpyruvate--protein phosphotransferase [Brevundimonas sp.]|uniref:phosphoenolpyruvate--protein phosphotransferase n=1 Tax=Brevundimonas sp. TaxID=1871086 RepID=UPI001AD539C8|nr:phosphoenolpyruvate--protein phosphotransferase [Brevundimonas sp.]MBN9465163.1 phosphoenolpyruvate--protein phosphotransferase [Brevundimonas sp.]
MSEILIHAPFAGWLTPLEDTPDAAFAQGMVGPGGAIDPIEGDVRAPLPGVVVAVAATRHAVTLRSDEGVELLIHVGIDTVVLRGEGFTAHVAAGDRVQTGDLLLTVDLDGVAETARDLISPLIVTGGADQIRLLDPRRRVSCGDPVLAVRPLAATTDPAIMPTVTRTVRAKLPHGLHARPSARIAAALKPFDAEVVIAVEGRTASAASVTALMQLNATDGDVLQLSASGAQADQALDALVRLIEAGLEETPDAERPVDRSAAATTPSLTKTDDGEWILAGVTASPGLAFGRTVRLQTAEISVPMDGEGVEIERAALENALCVVRDRLDQAATEGAVQQRAIAQAHRGLLDDPALTQDAIAHIGAGRSAAYAWRETLQTAAGLFRDLGDPRMAERADDLMDINNQVVAVLTGAAPQTATNLGPGVILIADDLLPSQLIGLQPGQIGGLCIGGGGPTSHVAILAAAIGLPALVAVGSALEQAEAGALAILDADNRQLILHPTAARQAQAQSRCDAAARIRKEAQALADTPCQTADGVRIEVFANLGHVAEAAPAVTGGAEGCGLLRTEFLFLDRTTPPDEDEQLACYQAIADALQGRPFILRTLDAGGDKPLAYMPAPPEENPALGLRGVRSGLARPDLLLTQLRAACRVRSPGPVGVMLPMIASRAEILQVRALLDRALAETGARRPLLGVMIETPAAAMTVDLLHADIDFISIGSNDLTQYALAMDRQNPSLAAQLDALHPAVLRLIGQAADKGAGLNWIGVCGGMASDTASVAILIGLGVRELSVAPARVAEIKAEVRRWTLPDCIDLARKALAQDGPDAVRALVIAHRQP